MNRYLLYVAIIVSFSFCFPRILQAQTQTNTKDDVVQLFGVVMTADSLRGIPMASIIVEGKGRGTFTNDQGVFSIVVEKGDTIRFSCVGFKDHIKAIPTTLEGNQYSIIQLMVNDTTWLPATILKPRLTREQFERDFVNASVPMDQIEIARQNTEEAKRRILLSTLPPDGREAVGMQMRKQATQSYYQGQPPPLNIFNPAAWADFIQAWKRGDFKSK